MTKIFARISVVAVAVVGIAMVAPRTVHAAAATANATATIIAPITITKDVDLDFASIVPGAGGTVVVDTADTRTCGGGLVCTGAVSSASFTVGGQAGANYTIAVAPATLVITDGSGNSMNVDTWTTAPTSPATLSGAPPDSLTVGATLHVGAGQAAGVYSGTFSVTAEYN